MPRLLLFLSFALAIFTSCEKSDSDPKLYEAQYTITANFVLDKYKVVKRDDPRTVLLDEANPVRESSVTRTDNGVNYTFSTYSGTVRFPDRSGRYTFVLPSTTHYRIVRLTIGDKTFDYRGGVPIHFDIDM